MAHDETTNRRRRQAIVFVCVIVVLVVLDQITKYLARTMLVPGEKVPVIPGVFDFQLVFNKGAAFGIFQNATAYFIVVAVIILAAIAIYLIKVKEHATLEVVGLALIASGAIGNCIDRIFFDGTVTDFIATAFMEFPVFNVADSGVTIGCILFILAFLLSLRSQKGEKGSAADTAKPSDGTHE